MAEKFKRAAERNQKFDLTLTKKFISMLLSEFFDFRKIGGDKRV